MKYLIFMCMFLMLSCASTEIIKVPFIPKIVCPGVEVPIYEEFTEFDDEEEMLIIAANNLEKAVKYIQQLKIRIECFEKNIDKFNKNEIEEANREILEADKSKNKYIKIVKG